MSYSRDEREAARRVRSGGAEWSGSPVDVWEGRVNQNDVPAASRPCFAHGCPLLGTISDSLVSSPAAHWFCRYHSAAKPEEFGEITRRLRFAFGKAADKAHAAEGTPDGMSSEEWAAQWKRERAAILATPKPTGRDWAEKLRRREENGEDLSPLQRAMWRGALAARGETSDELSEAEKERAAIQAEGAPIPAG